MSGQWIVDFHLDLRITGERMIFAGAIAERDVEIIQVIERAGESLAGASMTVT